MSVGERERESAKCLNKESEYFVYDINLHTTTYNTHTHTHIYVFEMNARKYK